MLRNTFRHIPGIGAKTERDLWASGVLSWDDVAEDAFLPMSDRRAEAVRDVIYESIDQLADDNARYFQDTLAPREHWRMFPEFRHTVAYLDIETTGLSASRHYITTIALYDGRDIHHYIHDENLTEFAGDISQYRLIVTYNGKTFDLPFIREYLGVAINQAHIDLRYVLASLGYHGGLKRCEQRLGLDRKEMADVDGYFAVLLWHDYYNRGNRRALETLLTYNMLDVVNLATLTAMAYNMKIESTPFARTHRLPVPAPPALPFAPDVETIRRIKREHGWY